MKSMAISVFKAHALQVIDTVASEHESITITRRGKPLAKVVPFRSAGTRPVPGKLATSFVYEKDILTPLGGALWEATR